MKNLLTNDNNLPAFEDAITELFRSELEKAINEILQHELTVFLDYERYERSENKDYRNGSYLRKFNTKYGVLNINMPRDRLGEFYCTLLPKYKRHDYSTDKTIIDLFNAGLSNNDISKIVESLCGASYSKQTISNITDKCIETIDAFKNRPLSKEYAVVYTDATYMSLRRDTIAKEAIHIAIGITVEGNKEILGYEIAPNESAEIWKSLLSSFKQRGLERISLICTDGLNGMENAINETYPQANIQRCIVHVSRNISAKVRVKDRREILQDFKEVYKSKTKELALEELDTFKDKWKRKYPQVISMLENNQYLFTYFDYPQEVRSSIYTTNLIEAVNKQIKRKYKLKEQFPTEQSMEKYLVSQFNQYNDKSMNRIHKGFGLTTRDQWFKD
jgi:transposase-like protein